MRDTKFPFDHLLCRFVGFKYFKLGLFHTLYLMLFLWILSFTFSSLELWAFQRSNSSCLDCLYSIGLIICREVTSICYHVDSLQVCQFTILSFEVFQTDISIHKAWSADEFICGRAVGMMLLYSVQNLIVWYDMKHNTTWKVVTK